MIDVFQIVSILRKSKWDGIWRFQSRITNVTISRSSSNANIIMLISQMSYCCETCGCTGCETSWKCKTEREQRLKECSTTSTIFDSFYIISKHTFQSCLQFEYSIVDIQEVQLHLVVHMWIELLWCSIAWLKW